jgi:hypothetical protein
MPTLKEAVESGRRWRFRNSCDWHPPGPIGGFWQTEIAITDDFEIEPEPEKPRGSLEMETLGAILAVLREIKHEIRRSNGQED